MQKQNETETKKLQTKVVDSMIFGFHCNSSFSIDINTNRLHFVLAIGIYFDKNLNFPKVLAAIILVK